MNSELQLRDIHLPPDVGFWPPALGWWVLLLVLAILLVLLLRWWQRRKPAAPRRSGKLIMHSALAELDDIEQQHRDNPAELVKKTSALLRRCAISLHGRHRISGLTGQAWLTFLDGQSRQPVFGDRFKAMLTELPYREETGADVDDLLVAVRYWLNNLETSYHV